MTLFNLLFFAIAALIVASTVLAVTRRNLVHAVIYLIFGFFGSAFLFYLFGATFLAALMVIVYAGAIMILFLFIIMMLRVEAPEERLFPPRQLLPAVLFATAYVVVGALLLLQDATAVVPLPEVRTGPAAFGRYIFTQSWLAVEIASLLLLVAMVGALLVGKRPAGESEE
ncbi:MAG: NADH-quinone oxidoreductase subunit J [Acidobacteria bacterium]|nr:NADH-quinone oxidoreductase subunit J [Acidobacteriota bacterium]